SLQLANAFRLRFHGDDVGAKVHKAAGVLTYICAHVENKISWRHELLVKLPNAVHTLLPVIVPENAEIIVVQRMIEREIVKRRRQQYHRSPSGDFHLSQTIIAMRLSGRWVAQGCESSRRPMRRTLAADFLPRRCTAALNPLHTAK